ncbi:MAG: hypothetical protein RIT25_379, partial [Planctomycetota bacterium]
MAVEEYRPFEGDRLAPARSFLVLADGTALYREATQLRFDPDGTLALPVFASACCYRLVPDSVRLLSRKLHKAGALDLAGQVAPAAEQVAGQFPVALGAGEYEGVEQQHGVLR